MGKWISACDWLKIFYVEKLRFFLFLPMLYPHIFSQKWQVRNVSTKTAILLLYEVCTEIGLLIVTSAAQVAWC